MTRLTLPRLAALAAILALAPAAVRAQSSGTLTPFFAYTGGSAVNHPASVGASLAVFGGPLGVRGGGSIQLDDRDRLDPGAPRGWDADADLVLRVGGEERHGRHHDDGMGLVPYGFVGLGGRSRPESTLTSTVSVFSRTWSYGGGLSLVLNHSLEIQGEARHRELRRDADYVGGSRWTSAGAPELRLGVAVRF